MRGEHILAAEDRFTNQCARDAVRDGVHGKSLPELHGISDAIGRREADFSLPPRGRRDAQRRRAGPAWRWRPPRTLVRWISAGRRRFGDRRAGREILAERPRQNSRNRQQSRGYSSTRRRETLRPPP